MTEASLDRSLLSLDGSFNEPVNNRAQSSGWGRISTFGFGKGQGDESNFAFGRGITEALGLDYDNDDAWTGRLIKAYAAVEEADQREGDIPLPSGFAREWRFWRLIAASSLIGGFMGLIAVGFMSLVDHVPSIWVDNGNYTEANSCYYNQGKLYWIAITGGTGLLVGLLRFFCEYPMNLPGIFKDVNDYHVDPKWVPYTFIISGIGLGGGANLGPEQALGNLGGGIGTYLSHDDPFNFGFEEDDKKLLVLAGMCGALGALFPSPILGVLMIYELGNPPKSMMESIVILSAAAFTGFIIYYALLSDYTNTLGVELLNGKSYNFIVAYKWKFELWQCGTAFLIGITSGIIVLSAIIVIGITKQIFARIRMRLERNKFLQNVLPPIIGGVIIGAVNYALPCTVGDGNMVIKAIVRFGYLSADPDGPDLPPELMTDDIINKIDGNGSGSLDSHILVSTAFAKMFLLGVSMNCGFVGGFVFPTILIGIISGMVCFQLFPGIPIGMCIACFMAAVPSGICPMPFTLAGLAIYLLHLGLYQTVPIFISVITAYTVVCGTGIFTALQQRALKKAREAANAGKDTQSGRNMTEEKNFAISRLRGNGAKSAQGQKTSEGTNAGVLEGTHNISPTVSQSNV